jgi:hypothetical protein
MLLAAGAALMPSACARDDSSIFIAGVLVGTQSNGMCTFMAQTTSAFLLAGNVDAAFAGQYTGVLQVENQLVSRGNANQLKTETSYVNLYEAEVQVLDPTAGMNAISQFSVAVSGFLGVGQTGTPGLGVSQVVMVDAATIKAKGASAAGGTQQQVVSSVILKGRTLGGLEVHTQEFLYPITISYGSSCTATPGTPCVSTMAGSSSNTTAPCFPGQDGSLTCQEIAASLGACNFLECTTKGDLTTAHCPSAVPVDNSCCP